MSSTRKFQITQYIFVVILHFTYVFNQFTWLDHGDILGKRSIQSLNKLHSIFLSPFGSTYFYRPIVTLFNSINYIIFGFNPFGYHLTNVLIFAYIPIIAISFLSLFAPFTRREKYAIFLLLAVHPLGWLPVGAISYRPELLFSAFTLLTVISHVRFRMGAAIRWRIAALVIFLCALLSKETSLFIIPAYIGVWELLNRKSKKSYRTGAIFVDEVLIVLLYAVLRVGAVGVIWGRSAEVSHSFQIGTTITVLNRLITMLFMPLLPPLSDAIPVTGVWGVQTALFMCMAVCTYIIYSQNHNTKIRPFLILTLLALIPALNVIHIPRLVSPHYAFLAVIPFIGGLVIAGRSIPPSLKKPVVYLLVTTIVLMTWQTIAGGFRFANDETLFAPEVQRDPHFLEGHFYLGYYFNSTGEFARAEQEYTRALTPNKGVIAYVDSDAALINLADVKVKLQKYSEAKKLLLKARQSHNPSIRSVAEYDLRIFEQIIVH